MAEKVEISCPTCLSNEKKERYQPWVEVEDPVLLYSASSGVQGTQKIVECLNCGLLYESPRFSREIILKGYESSEESQYDEQYPLRVKTFRNSLSRLKNLLPPSGARVLDIGAGSGAFVEAAKEFGYESQGIEPSAFLVKEGRKRGLNLKRGTVETLEFDEKFDLISLWDVLEHVTEPRSVLEKANELLKPGGMILINYPDIGTLPAKLTGKRYWWIVSVHLQHFDRKSLTEICDRTGFDIRKFKPHWQQLEFGHLIHMAENYRYPFSGLMKKFIPKALQSLPLPYYACQTTALASKRSPSH